MKIVQIHCEDRYEAEKLAGIATVQKDGSIFLEGIASVVGLEVIVRLKDKSAHSVSLRDAENVARLSQLVRSVSNGMWSVVSSSSSGSLAEITVEENFTNN